MCCSWALSVDVLWHFVASKTDVGAYIVPISLCSSFLPEEELQRHRWWACKHYKNAGNQVLQCDWASMFNCLTPQG